MLIEKVLIEFIVLLRNMGEKAVANAATSPAFLLCESSKIIMYAIIAAVAAKKFRTILKRISFDINREKIKLIPASR